MNRYHLNELSTTTEGSHLLTQALEVMCAEQRMSAPLLQQRLRIGYARAIGLMEQLETLGFISPGFGAASREILRYPSADEPINGGTLQQNSDRMQARQRLTEAMAGILAALPFLQADAECAESAEALEHARSWLEIAAAKLPSP